MLFDTLLIDGLTSELRIARVRDGILQEVEIHRAVNDSGAGGHKRHVGDIIQGRVRAVVAGLHGAFIEIGDDADGFLPFPEKSKKPPLVEGQDIIVQVRNEAMGEKGARLTNRVNFSGSYSVYLPGQSGIHVPRNFRGDERAGPLVEAISAILPSGDGAIIRTAAFAPGQTVSSGLVERDFSTLCKQWVDALALADRSSPPALICQAPDPVQVALRGLDLSVVKRIVIDGGEAYGRIYDFVQASLPPVAAVLERHGDNRPLFDALAIDEQIEAALEPCVGLAGGGHITISQTPACITVDVDSGAASNKGSRAQVINRTNLEACDALLHHLRLRNLAGPVVIDFISSRDRKAGQALLKHLQTLAAQHSVPVQVAGFTRLGLVECLRRRRSPSLADILCGQGGGDKSPRSLAYDALRSLYGEGRGNPGRSLELRASGAICDLLNGSMNSERQTVQRDLGVEINITRAPSSPAPGRGFDVHAG